MGNKASSNNPPTTTDTTNSNTFGTENTANPVTLSATPKITTTPVTTTDTPTIRNNSAKPATPTIPNNSTKPPTPTIPNNSAKPATPTIPNNSAKPATPTIPNNSAKPATPTIPNNSAKPATPTIPNNSAKPATPTNATTTVTSTETTSTTTTAVRTATPTPSVTSTTSPLKKRLKDVINVEKTSKPTFYSVVKEATSDTSKTNATKAAFSHWYRWTRSEQKEPLKRNASWYLKSPEATPAKVIDTLSPSASTLTMTSAKLDVGVKESSNMSDIIVAPTYQLRSTAVYSPPHGDRFQPGRNELINTDTSVFKYYIPENRSNQTTTGIHTKATMYKMNTRTKQIPLPTQVSSPGNTNTNNTGENSTLPTYISRGLQTDFAPPSSYLFPLSSTSYEKQRSHIVPVSAFNTSDSSNQGFYHLASQNTANQPVLPPVEKTPVWSQDQPYLSDPSLNPSYPPPSSSQPPAPLPPSTSILKKSSTVLSQDMSNPFSEQTHNRILEELRKRPTNTKDDMFRIKKVHLLEKNDPQHQPPTVKYNLQPSSSLSPSGRADQSISRSERLFSSQSFNRKK